MTDFVKELCYIKNVQREFNNKFGKKLVVDIPATKGVDYAFVFSEEGESKDEMVSYLNRLVNFYKVDLETIRTTRKFSQRSAELQLIRNFCCAVIARGWNQTSAGKLINRDRSCFRYFSDRHKHFDNEVPGFES